MPSTRSSLISRIRDLDARTSWVEFDRLYRPLLSQYARARGQTAEEAEEIVQQTLEVVVAQIGQFKKRKSFRAWLKQIVDNKIKQYLRKRKRIQNVPDDALNALPATNPSPAEIWDAQWKRTHLLYCLSNVRKEFADHTFRSFELYVLKEMPVAQIAELLGLSHNQVYVSKSRVMRRLKETLAELTELLYGGKE